MAITVGDVFTRFPSFPPEDMETLVGRKDFDGKTGIPLSKFAEYDGKYAKDLSVFVAEREKQNYTKLLSDNQRTQVNEQLGIKDNTSREGETIPTLPMDVSVFDYKKPDIA